MKKIFQLKYLRCTLAALVLTLAIMVVLAPKIEDYNRKVFREQAKLYREAGGSEARRPLSKYDLAVCFYQQPIVNTAGFLLAIFFLSLVLTKRIVFSFLFMFLFAVQIILFELVMSNLREVRMSFDYSIRYYVEWIIAFSQMVLSFWLALTIFRFGKRKFQGQYSFE